MAQFPSQSAASGLWSLKKQKRAQQGLNWPPLYGPADDYFEYVTMLLPGNGTNGAQNNTFLDSSTNNFTITRNGNTTQGTFSPYGSNWSNYFGATGQYLSIPYNSAFNLTGDFTIECWINPGNLPSSTGNAAQSYERVFSFGTYNAANSIGLEINSNDSGNIRRFISWYNGTMYSVSANNAVAPGNWYHIALVRSGTTITFYINGVSTGLTITGASAAVNTSQALYIASLQGFESDASAAYNGYISNFRVVKGTAVYTSNFTPPTAPLTAITNTSLLTCQSNRFIDNSTNAFTITRNGDVSIQRFSPFSPTAPYAAGTDRGSGYFDGSGDYLTAANNAAFRIGSGDFTIECWVYLTSLSNSQSFISLFNTNGTNPGYTLYKNGSTNKIEFYCNGGTPYLISTPAITTGQWTHLAVVRNGSSMVMYMNGASVATATNSSFTDETSNPLYIGARADALSVTAVSGYIADARIVKGTAVYTAAFTPPTAPLTAITNTSLLTNFTNAGILDNAEMNNLETVGNAQISTAQSKFGGASMAFDGTGDWLIGPANQNAALGTGDFTVEGWLYVTTFSTTTGFQAIFSNRNSNSTQTSFDFGIRNSDRYLYFYNRNTDASTFSTAGLSGTNTWVHVAIARVGSTITFYINGTASGTVSVSTNSFGTSNVIYVGSNFNTTPDTFNGYIDDLRITKGYARYTANFTPQRSQWQDQ